MKKLIIISLVLMMLFAFVACDGEAGGKTGDGDGELRPAEQALREKYGDDTFYFAELASMVGSYGDIIADVCGADSSSRDGIIAQHEAEFSMFGITLSIQNAKSNSLTLVITEGSNTIRIAVTNVVHNTPKGLVAGRMTFDSDVSITGQENITANVSLDIDFDLGITKIVKGKYKVIVFETGSQAVDTANQCLQEIEALDENGGSGDNGGQAGDGGQGSGQGTNTNTGDADLTGGVDYASLPTQLKAVYDEYGGACYNAANIADIILQYCLVYRDICTYSGYASEVARLKEIYGDYQITAPDTSDYMSRKMILAHTDGGRTYTIEFTNFFYQYQYDSETYEMGDLFFKFDAAVSITNPAITGSVSMEINISQNTVTVKSGSFKSIEFKRADATKLNTCFNKIIEFKKDSPFQPVVQGKEWLEKAGATVLSDFLKMTTIEIKYERPYAKEKYEYGRCDAYTVWAIRIMDDGSGEIDYTGEAADLADCNYKAYEGDNSTYYWSYTLDHYYNGNYIFDDPDPVRYDNGEVGDRWKDRVNDLRFGVSTDDMDLFLLALQDDSYTYYLGNLIVIPYKREMVFNTSKDEYEPGQYLYNGQFTKCGTETVAGRTCDVYEFYSGCSTATCIIDRIFIDQITGLMLKWMKINTVGMVIDTYFEVTEFSTLRPTFPPAAHRNDLPDLSDMWY